MLVTDVFQLHGAASRSSSRPQVISIRRCVARKPGLNRKLSPGYSDGQLGKVKSPRDGTKHNGQAGRPTKSSIPSGVSAYDRETLVKKMKLPKFKKAPDILRSCYKDGFLSFPLHIRNHFWVIRYVKVEKYIDRSLTHKFQHRLSFSARDFPEVTVQGQGTTKVRLI
jgi:hypothetical protein